MLLEMKQISKSFSGVEVLHQVDLAVEKGEVRALLGANGIYAVVPQRKHLPLRVRLWLDFLKHQYGQPGFWGGRLQTVHGA